MRPTIRAITGFISVPDFARYDELRDLLLRVRDALRGAGYQVQTVRITTDVLETVTCRDAVIAHESFLRRLASDAEVSAHHLGSLCNAIADDPATAAWAADLLLAHPRATLTVDAGAEIVSRLACRTGARICRAVGAASPFQGGRFAVYAGVRSSTPFYPASRVFGNSMRFAIGCQCANLAVEEASLAGGELEQFEKGLRIRLETEFSAIGLIMAASVSPSEVGRFLGFDTSLAPRPSEESSIAHAIELTLGKPFGSSGTLAVCRTLTRAMQENNLLKTGLCGLMLPVIEDSVLAQRGIEGGYTVRELLLYSAVCATGLDTVPISGRTSEADLADCYLDLATLAVKLGKPLSARFFVEHDRLPGDTVTYDWQFAAPSRVFDL